MDHPQITQITQMTLVRDNARHRVCYTGAFAGVRALLYAVPLLSSGADGRAGVAYHSPAGAQRDYGSTTMFHRHAAYRADVAVALGHAVAEA